MRRRRTSLLGGLLYPPLAGSDFNSNSSSHFRPWPDFRNFSRFRADLWSECSSLYNKKKSPISWIPFVLLARCSRRRLSKSLVIPTYRLMLTPKSGHKVKLDTTFSHTDEGKGLLMMNEYEFGYRTSQCI